MPDSSEIDPSTTAASRSTRCPASMPSARARRAGPGLPGRRRRPRPAARSRDGADLDVAIEGEVRGPRRPARATSPSARALPHRPARGGRPGGRRRPDARRDLPAPRRPAGGAPGHDRGGPGPPGLHGQRDGYPLAGDGGADRPARGARDLRAGLLRVLHDDSFVDDPPGRCEPPATRRGSASTSSPGRRAAGGRRTSRRSRRTGSRTSCAGSPPRRIRLARCG